MTSPTTTENEIKHAMNIIEEISNLVYTIEQGIVKIQETVAIIPDIESLKFNIDEGLKLSSEMMNQLELYCEEKIKDPSVNHHLETCYGRILGRLPQLKKQVSNLKVNLRKAVQIYSNKEHETSIKKGKLLGSSTSEERKALKSNQSGKQQSRQSRKITDSLKRTKAIIAQNLERTSNSMEQLSEQSSIFQKAVKSQDEYQDKVNQSTKLIRELKWKERRDHFITLVCFLFYVVVILVVFNHRIPLISIAFYIMSTLWSLFSGIFHSSSSAGSTTSSSAPIDNFNTSTIENITMSP
ncbi:hypothetical protein FDP41_003431 [Naegleria fowleri]|uniref:Sec20 C-terminal domain-containing protein n=1 Tax=Naegleria fowleri TaxID=5763 RepID=A0A6A5BWZ1_NAEFO|nr:uncharacterized protein FDP41_003431 [Naegleria fowleri]KAF0977439.1 hypothetical protein FDP41_003431 [Naegleria fowleri]CAG4713359.1 unnamed protein product [Naegleria fowleri]